jgi:hypothetical protein
MSTPGVSDSTDLLVQARSALLDAIEALDRHRHAVIVVGAQAVYLRTGGLDVALAEATKDSDVVLDPSTLQPDPRIEEAMGAAGFFPSANGQPGSWVNPHGIPVDLMVPAMHTGNGSSRGGRIPPHSRRATRRARGLEAAIVDSGEMEVSALDPADGRVVRVRVAGPAALLVAKLHKIAERRDAPHRLNDKDAHDAYRVLRAVETEVMHEAFLKLLRDDLSRDVSREALDHLEELFAGGPDALGSEMAGRAEEGVGDPEGVAVAVSILAADLVGGVRED